ncbi:MAG: hypothetical protein C5B43_03025 [Verrucomicrobia bacterium]|nr:MAG: hypothetical protein C5B43_03025 [Verrucomicrobiota bacterium]
MHFLCYTAAILGIGSVVGGILFVLIGMYFTEYTFFYLIKKGIWVGFRYAGVWAGGSAIVLCFVKGGKKGKKVYGE